MATIVYSRTVHQPEILYLPLEHGGFIQLQDGAHEYPNHAAYGLKNSTNPVVKQYINQGNVVVILDDDVNVSIGTSIGKLNPHQRQFAPLLIESPSRISYAPMSDGFNQLTTAQYQLESIDNANNLNEIDTNDIPYQDNINMGEPTKTTKKKLTK